MGQMTQRSPEDIQTLMHIMLGENVPNDPVAVLAAFERALSEKGFYPLLRTGEALGIIK